MAKRGRKPKESNAIYMPYEGFTVRDQMVALEECKQEQLARQERVCGVCSRGMDDGYVCWISSGGNESLRKWAQGKSRAYDPVRRVNVYRKRSPAEIKEEYASGLYFLCHGGCLTRARNSRYSLGGRPVQRLYVDKLRAMGIADGAQVDESLAFELWRQCQAEVEERGQRRMREVAEMGREALMKNNKEWGTGAWRKYKKKPRGPQPFSERARRAPTPQTAQGALPKLNYDPEVMAALEQEAGRPKPLDDIEQRGQELLARLRQSG